jgi:DNA-binding IclR family transcriptional regulator
MAVGGETSQTLDRGLRLLRLVADRGAAGITVTELARLLDVGRPVVYRLVATLSDHALVRRSPDAKVRLGPGVLHFAAALHPALRQAANPILRRLADAAGATAHFTIAEGEEALALCVVEPTWTDFHVGYRVGSRHGLERGAAGRAILAGRSGGSSVVTTRGELQEGATGLAAPVLGIAMLEASVGVITVESLDERRLAPLVAEAAAAVAEALQMTV